MTFDSPSIASRSPPTATNAEPTDSVTSGFGAVMDQEHAIQSALLAALRRDNGPHSIAIARILLQQQTWISSNISMLARRIQSLPHPGRFRDFRDWRHPLDRNQEPGSGGGTLSDLIAQHEHLLRSLETLIESMPQGDRDERILREVAHNHREMAWMLTSLLKEDEQARGGEFMPQVSTATRRGRLETWENEGGSLPA